MTRRRSALQGLLVAALLCAVCLPAGAQSTATLSQSLLGKQAPVFTRTDLNGKKIDLGQLRGKVVLLNFWATWCAPCQIEMPAFVRWQRQFDAQGFQVIGISMDDDAPPVRRVVDRLNLNYPVAMGDENLGELYGGVLGLPLTYLIDRNGVIRARFQGETSLRSIQSKLQPLLDQR